MKIEFYPIKNVDIPFQKSINEIVKEFLSFKLVVPDLNYDLTQYQTFKEFYTEILYFISENYGEPSKPLTVGEISNLFACYSSLNYQKLN